MKTVYEHAVGGDGAIAGLYVDDAFVYETFKYPLPKALGPANDLIDGVVGTLEEKFPVADSILEGARSAAKAALAKLVGG